MSLNRILFAFLFLLFKGAIAQAPIESPYSRFGLGITEPAGQVQSLGMGGTAFAVQNDTLVPLFINPANPATYNSVRLTTFEVGAKSTYNILETNTQTVKRFKSNLNYVMIGVPLRRIGGMTAGLQPYTQIGYKTTSFSEVQNIGTVRRQYEGDGGLHRAFLGLAIRPFGKAYDKFIRSAKYKALRDSNETKAIRNKVFFNRFLSSFSIGANGFYYFGTVNHVSRLIYPSGLGVLNTKLTREAVIGDFNANVGLLWNFEIDQIKGRDLKRNVRLQFGYVFNPNWGLSSKGSSIGYTYILGPFEREFPRDTVLNEQNVGGSIQMPAMHGLGFAFMKGTNFILTADFETQAWSNFTYFGNNQGFSDATRIAIGVQWIPERLASGGIAALFKRVQYRAGIRYYDSYMSFYNNKLKDYAASVGFGIPVGNFKLFTILNLAVEYGTFGTKENGLLKEKYVRGILGLTFNDRWFIKPKYD